MTTEEQDRKKAKAAKKDMEDADVLSQVRAYPTMPKNIPSDDDFTPSLEQVQKDRRQLIQMDIEELEQFADNLGINDPDIRAELESDIIKDERKWKDVLIDYIESVVEVDDLEYNNVEKVECANDSGSGWDLCNKKEEESIIMKINQLDDETLIAYMEVMDRYDLLRIAKSVGFNNNKGTKEKLIEFIIDFASEEHNDYPSVTLKRGVMEFAYAKKDICALARSPKSAHDAMTFRGINDVFIEHNTEHLHAGGGIRVDNISAYRPSSKDMKGAPYSACRMMPRTLSIKHYQGRKQKIEKRMHQLIREDSDDPMDIREKILLGRSLRSVENIIDDYPIMGFPKCYCGELKAFMADDDVEEFCNKRGVNVGFCKTINKGKRNISMVKVYDYTDDDDVIR